MNSGRDERNVLSQTRKLHPFFRMIALSASLSRLGSATSAFNRRFSSSADPVLPAEIRGLLSSLMLLQDPNDLVFRVPALLHPSPPVQITRELQSSLDEFFGQVKSPYAGFSIRR
jgi:hypothetical protein